MEIRTLQTSNLDAVARELATLWYASAGADAPQLGMSELYAHLSRADAGLAAVDDQGQLLGVVLMQAPRGHEQPFALKSYARDRADRLRERLRALGLDDQHWILEAEDELLQQVEHERGTAGEIVLLVVAQSARGQGLGKRLLRAGAQWLAEQGASQLRLVTDDDCDWQVYEHLGMERVAQDHAERDFALDMYVYQLPIAQLIARLAE